MLIELLLSGRNRNEKIVPITRFLDKKLTVWRRHSCNLMLTWNQIYPFLSTNCLGSVLNIWSDEIQKRGLTTEVKYWSRVINFFLQLDQPKQNFAQFRRTAHETQIRLVMQLKMTSLSWRCFTNHQGRDLWKR